MNYFTIEELCYSDTARIRVIDNIPNTEERKNLERLIDFLNPLRGKWGSGIMITSGYRNDQLNKAVGGVENSSHRTGNAADLYPVNGKFEQFKTFMVNYLKDKNFDQCIIESNTRGEKWIHFGLFSNDNQQRKEIFQMKV